MQRLAFPLMVLSICVGCGPPLDLATDVSVPTCGENGPVRLMSHFTADTVQRVGNRLVMTGWPKTVDDDGETNVGPSTIRSVGLCGEEPAELVPGDPTGSYEILRRHVATIGDLVLACDSGGSVDRVDPRGVEPAMHLLDETMCHFVSTSRGVVAYSGGDLILLRSADWGAGPDYDILTSPAAWTCRLGPPCDYVLESDPPQFFVLQDRVFYISERTLMEVDLDGNATPIAPDVAAIDVPSGGDRILVSVEAEDGEASLSSFDPATGSFVELGRDDVSVAWPLALRRSDGETTLVDIRDGTPVALPTGPVFDLLPISSMRRGTFLETSSDPDEPKTLHRWDDERRAWQEVGSFGPCFGVRDDRDRVVISKSDCDGTFDVLFVDPQGREPTVAARGVSGRVVVQGDRVVWSTERGEGSDLDVHGELFASEPGNTGRWRLDREAWIYEEPPHPDLGGDVLYNVEDGERTGVWRTALP